MSKTYTKLVIGKRTIRVPDELIDYEEFIIKVLSLYPNIKTTDNTDNPFVFEKGQLQTVVRSLSTYEQIQWLAKRAGVKKDIANAVGQMLINNGALLELGLVEMHMSILRDPEAARKLEGQAWEELKKDLVEELGEEEAAKVLDE